MPDELEDRLKKAKGTIGGDDSVVQVSRSNISQVYNTIENLNIRAMSIEEYLAVRKDLAKVLEAIETKLTDGRERFGSLGNAYHFLEKGYAELDKEQGSKNFTRAIDYFTRATEQDPNCKEAWAYLALTNLCVSVERISYHVSSSLSSIHAEDLYEFVIHNRILHTLKNFCKYDLVVNIANKASFNMVIPFCRKALAIDPNYNLAKTIMEATKIMCERARPVS